MKFIADLHVHSHFSRATSPALDPEHLALWAGKKGITVIGTGDFTHPGWVSELQEKLVEAEEGLFRLRPGLEKRIQGELPASCRGDARFILSGEISCIYKKGDKTRKLHHLILMPDMGSLLRLNEKLDRIGNITSDGRPILGLDSKDLLEIVLEVNDRAFFIPAHIWTPWFSLFGSKSGFDSLEECFEDLSPHIHALETGLSSDPPMNRLLSDLDDYILVSNSDAHSPSKLGREGNLFDTELGYDNMIGAMKKGEGFGGTIEFFPEEGKYHLDGHRKCQVRLHPRETISHQGICPSCGKPVTVGVLHRVYELSDRERPERSKDFFSLIPLTEILSEILGFGPSTKRVTNMYEGLLNTLGPELHILMEVPFSDLEAAGGVFLATAIERMRESRVIREEGYDGEYGVIRLFEKTERHELSGQATLFAPQKGHSGPKKKNLQGDEEISLRTKKPAPVAGVRQPEILTKGEQDDFPGRPSTSDPILDPLNPAQREAVLHRGAHLLIVAGPGTGKTMTLSCRIAHLVRSGDASPGEILALTFTNKAAREMGERVTSLLLERDVGRVLVSTFHGFCLEVLRKESERLNLSTSFSVCSEWDGATLANQVVSESGKKGKGIASRFLKRLPHLKIEAVMGKTTDPDDPLIPLFEKYQARLRQLGMLDLDDLETETVRLFREHPGVCLEYAERFPMVFVDEYQDTNPIQVELLKMIVRTGPCQICAIGDPDQAIYGFRGADVQNFLRFSEVFPGAKVVELFRNYRSSRAVLEGSAALIGREKPLEGVIEKGGPIRLASCRTESEEAEMIVEQVEKLLGATTYFSLDSGRVSSHEEGENLGFGDIAVLFRLNSQGDALEKAFKRAGIPFIRTGEKPLIRRYPVNILWRFLQAVQYPDSDYHLQTYLDLPEVKNRGEGILGQFKVGGPLPALIDRAVELHGLDCASETDLEAMRRLKSMAKNFNGELAPFLDVLSLERGVDHVGLLGDRVSLMSLHGAKGLEWPVVFITGCEDRLIPCSLFGERNEAEEKRLFYVGMTRARHSLILSYTSRRVLNGRALPMDRSPFLDLVPERLFEPLERSAWKRRAKAHKQLELFQT